MQFTKNPIDNKDDVIMSIAGSLSATGDLSGGWWYDTKTGTLLANVSGYENH